MGVISPSGLSLDAKSQLALKMPLLKDGVLSFVSFLWLCSRGLTEIFHCFMRRYSFVKMSVSRERIKKTNEKLWSFGIRVALKRFSDVSFLIEKNNELFSSSSRGGWKKNPCEC